MRASGWRGPGCSTCASWTTLSYHYGADGLCVARKTVENFIARVIRLYEQEPREALASARLGLYVRRWLEWAGAGLGAASGDNPNTPPPYPLVRQFGVSKDGKRQLGPPYA